MESLSGEWEGVQVMNVTCYTDQLPPLFVDEVKCSLQGVALSLEQMLLPSHQH